METGSSMDIIRQRLFITHDSKNQRQILVEYTIRSKLPKLKNIFLNYAKFLPSLLINDEKGFTLPLMSSNDVEILYSNYIEQVDGAQKILLKNELEKIKNKKKYLIWISLKNNPILQDEVRTFTLTYLPEIEKIKKPEIFIKFKHQNYPVYYSLFSPNSFNFNKPKFLILKNNDITTTTEKPDYVDVYNSYQTLSLRITNEVDFDFGLLYSISSLSSSKTLTKLGAVFMAILPVMFGLISIFNISGFDSFLQKQIEVALFVMGASLLLPNIQPDNSIRRELMLWYLLPIILGLLMLVF